MTEPASAAGGQEERAPDGDAARRPSAAPFALWATLLGTLAAVQAGFGGKLLPVLVQGGSAALIAAIALAIFLAPNIRRRRLSGLRTVPELSMASALAAVSMAAMLSGLTIGNWLLIGGGLGLAAALGGLVREHRAEHRARVRTAPAGASRDHAHAAPANTISPDSSRGTRE